MGEVVVVPRRVLRQLIKRHRKRTAAVRHEHCYTLSTLELQPLMQELGLTWRPRVPTGYAMVLGEASPREAKRLGPEEVYRRELRHGFHAAVHVAFARLAAGDRLDEVTLRSRVRELGRAEFEEIRTLLERDDRLFSPDDDREVYVEFAASYLELRAFAPELVPAAFPGLTQLPRIDELLARDIEVPALMEACGVETPTHFVMAQRASAQDELPALEPVVSKAAHSLRSRLRQRWILGAARRAAYSGRDARSAILAARVLTSADAELRSQAEGLVQDAIQRLSAGLFAASGLAGSESVEAWSKPIRLLVLRASARGSRGAPEARVLELLERAARVQRFPLHLIRLSWRWRAGGRRVQVRQGRALRLVQVARLLARAAEQGDTLQLPEAHASLVLPQLRSACEGAQARARAALGFKLTAALSHAGLKPRPGLQSVARQRLVEELIDRILARGFISLPQLRDAISRNDLKLPDVMSTWRGRGDPLLVADALLGRTLIGVYRRGDVYLRALQRASSLAFGTLFGRVLFLYAVLPVGGAFILLEGAQHLLNPVLGWVGLPSLPAPEPLSVGVVAAVLLGLLHSQAARTLGRQLLEFLGVVAAWILFRIPHALLSLPGVQRWLSRPLTRWLLRHLVVPAMVAGMAFALTPLPTPELGLRIASAGVGFAATTWLMGSRLGFWLEGVLIERLAPTWRVLGQRWVPELLRLVGRAFTALVDGMERFMAGVDDALRSRRRPTGAWLALLTLLTLGWATLAYVVRVYVTLLVEPEINPLKHFPVVTVAHKIMLPFLPTLLVWIEKPFAILGPLLGGALAGLTVFLLPSVFGFLVWELKENYRLYEATRPRRIQPARFGPDGETLRELLVPGLHSGTLPKLHQRLRRAAQRSDERRQRARAAKRALPHLRNDPELRRFRNNVHAVRVAITRFVARELLPAVALHPGWALGALCVQRVEVSSNRTRISVACPLAAGEPCELTLEQLGGHIVAGFARAGFVLHLDPQHAQLFDNALAVFYHRAGVEIVREQIGVVLGAPDYEIVADGIRVYADGRRVQLTYPVDVRWPRHLKPRARGDQPPDATRPHARDLLYRHQPVSWRAWQRTWSPEFEVKDETARLIAGPSLLPVPMGGAD